MSELDEYFRKIAREEIARAIPPVKHQPVAEFCKERNLHRTTVWRGIRDGRIKGTKIGRKVFIDPSQFIH